MESREGRGAGGLGAEIFWRAWEPPDPRASLLAVHGLGEHSGRYAPLAGVLAEQGISVFAFDLRGHGKSSGPRGDVDAFPRFLEDLLSMEEEWGRQLPHGGPRFLLGHSMGGLIALRRLQVTKGSYSAAILSAPWLGTPFPQWVRRLGRFLGLAIPGIPIRSGLGPHRLTRDPEMAQAWREDPLIHTRITGRLFRGADQVQRETLSSRLPEDLPLLFLVPGDDKVVSPQTTLEFARGIVGAEVDIEILEGRLHEPLNDIGRDEVFALVLDWLGRRMGSQP